jgi:hypothetical protein
MPFTEPVNGNPAGFDLPGGEPAIFQALESILAKFKLVTLGGDPPALPAEFLAVFDFTWH